MSTNSIIFAGLDFASGRKPVTLAALEHDLKVVLLDRLKVSETVALLESHKKVRIGVNLPSNTKSQLQTYADFQEKLTRSGFQPYGRKYNPRQWFSTDAQACFRALSGETLLARRSFEGRIQRALLLYNQGLQIDDPMDIFEEITRYKLMEGILPLENIHSSRELDALVAAYVAWMTINQRGQIAAKEGVILLTQE